MTEQELAAIEARLVTPNRPLVAGEKVTIESFTGVDFIPYAKGVIERIEGDSLWLKDNPTRYWKHDTHRDEPSPSEDIAALIAEVKRVRHIELCDDLIYSIRHMGQRSLSQGISIDWALGYNTALNLINNMIDRVWKPTD